MPCSGQRAISEPLDLRGVLAVTLTPDLSNPRPAAPPGIRADNLVKDYVAGSKVVRALDGVCFDAQPGEFVAVVGRSGCGKSTLLNLLGGLDRPNSGCIWMAGHDLAQLTSDELATHRQQTVGMVFQFFHLIPTMSVLENVELALAFGRVRSRDRRGRAIEILARLRLNERLTHRPSELSGGEQQRVAIARALANDPVFVLADEPTGNLDSRTSEEIFAIFDDICGQGRGVVCVTHEVDLVRHRAHQVIELRDGKVISAA